MSNTWSNEEIEILKNKYQTSKNKEINKLLPKRSNAAIKCMAKKLKLYKLIHDRTNSSIEILLEESFISFYWIGFILADGNISKKRLEVSANIKDEKHIANLALFLNTKYKIRNKIGGYTKKITKQARISCCNKYNLEKVINKFDIKHNKTYCPPNTNIWNFTDNQLLSLIIGFIDGDGSIIKNKTNLVIRIKLHKSWIVVLDYFCNFLSKKYNIDLPIPFINTQDYAEWYFSKIEILNIIKKFIIENNLPVLNRKWDKINENRIAFEKSIELKNKVIKLFNSGYKPKEISQLVNKSNGYCSKIIRDYKCCTKDYPTTI